MTRMAAIAGQRYEPRTSVDELVPTDGNPNKGNVGAIQQSIESNTFYGAVIAQEGTGRIIVGHHRWRAAQAAGLEHIPVLFVDVDDRTADRMMLADNRTAELAENDHELLNDLLRTIAQEDGTLDGTGYDDSIIDGLLGNFDPGAAHDQPKLDRTKVVTCPECSHEFSPN